MQSKAGEAIRERMVQARREANLSQQDVAEVVRVKRQSVSKWETGKASPNPREFADWCIALGISTDWALTGTKTIPAAQSALVRSILASTPPNPDEQLEDN